MLGLYAGISLVGWLIVSLLMELLVLLEFYAACFHLQMLLGHANITTTLHYLKYAKLPDGIILSVLDYLLAKSKK